MEGAGDAAASERARRDDHRKGRIPVMHGSREPEAIDRARHLDIGEDEIILLVREEETQRFVAIFRLADGKARRLQVSREKIPNQRIVLDHEDVKLRFSGRQFQIHLW